MKHQPLLLFVLAIFLTSTLGCGYRFAGSGSYPSGVERIFITILENQTAETGVETAFTNDLIYEFTRNRKESLAQSRSTADAIMTGTIARLAVNNITRASASTAVERRVTGTLRLQLKAADGSLLWVSGNIVENEAYTVVSGNKTATDRNKEEAIATVSQKLAETAFNRLTDDF